MTIEEHLRYLFNENNSSVSELLTEWEKHTFRIIESSEVNCKEKLLGNSLDIVVNYDRKIINAQTNIENRCKSFFHLSAVAHLLLNSPESKLSQQEQQLKSELQLLKQKILDEENLIITTFFNINTFVHYCRILKPNNHDHYKREIISFMVNEIISWKYVDEIGFLENRKDHNNTLLIKKKIQLKLFEDRSISHPMIENVRKAFLATAPFSILEHNDKSLEEILMENKSLKIEISIYKTKLDEIIEDLLTKYESRIKLDAFNDFYKLFEYIETAVRKIIKDLKISDKFRTMKTGDFNHQLARLDKKNSEIEYINRIYSGQNFKLSVPQRFGGKFSVTAQRLLNMLLSTNTRSGESPNFSFTIEEYMALCNLKDRKETIKHIKRDLEILFESNYWWKEVRSEGKIRIIESWNIKNGIVNVKLAPTFWDIFKDYAVGLISTRSLAINVHKNPSSQHFSFKLTQHKYMNSGKPNENIIAVKTLLEGSEIPTYEDVMAGDRHIAERIIDRFERDMNALEDDLTWEYCHKNGEPLTENELKNFTYELFISLNILTLWKYFPSSRKLIKFED
jgi:hypothetical protein